MTVSKGYTIRSTFLDMWQLNLNIYYLKIEFYSIGRKVVWNQIWEIPS